MKTFVLSFASVFAVYTITAQQHDLASLNTDEVNSIINNVNTLNKKSIAKAKNADYLNVVNAEQPSREVRTLEQEIANFNIKEHAIYDDSEDATYQIVFNKKKANAVVTYRYTGEILAAKETYKDIKLPLDLRVKISREYPGWAFKSNVFTATYKKGKPIQKTYRIIITDSIRNKYLKFNLNE